MPLLSIHSASSTREVLHRLEVYGKDWHESKLPPEVRARGYFGCRIDVTPPTFKLRLEGQGRGPFLDWIGDVKPLKDTKGCEIRVDWRVAPVTWLALLPLLGFCIWIASTGALGFAVMAAVFYGIGIAVVVAIRSSAQLRWCDAIIRHVVAVPAGEPLDAPAI